MTTMLAYSVLYVNRVGIAARPTLCHHEDMDTAALDRAAQRYRDAEDALDEARKALQAEAVRALQAGARQVDVVRKTGWTREYLRRLKTKAEERPAEPDGP
jgi:hypothetical protein